MLIRLIIILYSFQIDLLHPEVLIVLPRLKIFILLLDLFTDLDKLDRLRDFGLLLGNLIIVFFPVLPLFVRHDRVALCVPLLSVELIFTGWFPVVSLLRGAGSRRLPLRAVTIITEADVHGGTVAPVSLLPHADEETSAELAHLTEFEGTVGLLVFEGA